MREEVRGSWYVRIPSFVCVSKSKRGEMRQWQDVGRARAFSSIYIIDMESIFTSSQKAGEEIEKENKTHSYPLFPLILPF